jgi:uncharacterized protein (TIGR02444 family)
VDAREQTYEQEQMNAAQRLWRFATTVYAAPGVAAACLGAQNDWSVDVNLMLYVSWCASEARHLKGDDILFAQERCRPWREQVILPLRQQRMAWRGQEAFAAEYAGSKTLELQAERTQLNFLASLVEEGSAGHEAKAAATVEDTSLLRGHFQILAVHYGLDEDVFGPFLVALSAA